MTVETDSIVNVFLQSGVTGVVTDVNTPLIHASNSWHYWKATPSATGNISTAVDFGNRPQRLTDEQALEVFNVFKPYGESGQLAELYCGQADWCVYKGNWMRWTSLPKGTRDAIRSAHRNHVHVAVRVGHFLKPVQQPVSPPLQASQEIDDMTQYEFDDGAIICLNAAGEVFCPEYAGRPTARHFGGITQLKDSAKIGFERAVSIAGIHANDSQGGYFIKDNRWTKDGFRFDSETLKIYGK